MSLIEMFCCWHKLCFAINLRQQFIGEVIPSINKVLIFAIGSSITDELRDINSVAGAEGILLLENES